MADALKSWIHAYMIRYKNEWTTTSIRAVSKMPSDATYYPERCFARIAADP